VVLRRYIWRWVLEDEPDVFNREVDALRFATDHGLPVPQVLAADANGIASGEGVPALVTSFVPGRAKAAPDLAQLADVALAIHTLDASAFEHRYAPWYQGAITEAPAGATDPRLWKRAIDIWHSCLPERSHNFIHRDFHPGNVLWRRNSAHIVDWASACSGPPGCDVAHCRDNLIFLSGFEAADDFLASYVERSGDAYDLFWEIASVLEHSKFPPDRIGVSELRLRPAVAAYT
jgi:Ser/Thr protein kinase RdoA (MazF antagonist)